MYTEFVIYFILFLLVTEIGLYQAVQGIHRLKTYSYSDAIDRIYKDKIGKKLKNKVLSIATVKSEYTRALNIENS